MLFCNYNSAFARVTSPSSRLTTRNMSVVTGINRRGTLAMARGPKSFFLSLGTRLLT